MASITLISQRRAKTCPEGRFIEEWVVEGEDGTKARLKTTSEWGEVDVWKSPGGGTVKLLIGTKKVFAADIVGVGISSGSVPVEVGVTTRLDDRWLSDRVLEGYTLTT